LSSIFIHIFFTFIKISDLHTKQTSTVKKCVE